MSDETLRTLITCGTTILVALISNVLVFAISKINNRSANENSILQKQYDHLFMPIHRILFFTKLNDNDKITQIHNILYDNYGLSTNFLREKYNECIKKKEITKDFISTITNGCLCLENNLGYTKTKLSKQQKEYSNVVFQSNKSHYFSLIFTIVSIILGIVSSLLVILWK